AFIACPGDLPCLAVLEHLNLKFPRHQEAHLYGRDVRLRRDIERVGLPFVRDTLTRIEIAMSPRGRRQTYEETPYHARDDRSPLTHRTIPCLRNSRRTHPSPLRLSASRS